MTLIESNALAAILLSVNLLASVSYFIINSQAKCREMFFKLPKILQKAYVGLFVIPLFTAPFLAQTRFFGWDNFFPLSGIAFSIIGFIFLMFSFTRIGLIPSIKQGGGFAKACVYGIVRHPIYAGTILVSLGFTMLNQSLVTLLYQPISIVLYYNMAVLEEKDLLETFGREYEAYQEKVKKRIIPLIL